MTQYARPDGLITLGSWTVTPLWDKIDEVVADDADYISSTGTDVMCDVSLSNVTDPVSSVSHIIRFRMRSAGSGAAESVNIFLVEGTQTRAITGAKSNRSSTYLEFTYTLTAAEANAITDYNNLHLQITGTHGATETVYVSWAVFEVPDAPSLPPLQFISQG